MMIGRNEARPAATLPMILGPTASGKSALALRWAERCGAQLISADSRQIYRHMDVGTATPSTDELARVRHHFVSEREPDEVLTAAGFAVDAEQRIQAILLQEIPVGVVGGSTLYLHALKEGFSNVPNVPADVRAALAAELESNGLAALVDEFKVVDPELAQVTDLHNPRRVLRALEVFRHTGAPLSSFQGARRPPRFRYHVVYLRPERTALYRQIEARVDQMMSDGLIAEVERLLQMGFSTTLQSLQSIGYAEIVSYLHGRVSLDEAVAAIKTNTRRYAKRQMTYFDKYFAEAIRVDPARTALDDAAIDRMLRFG